MKILYISLSLLIGFAIGMAFFISGSSIQQNDSGYYYDFEVLLPTPFVEYFLAFDEVTSIEETQGDMGTVHRMYLDMDATDEELFSNYLDGINYMIKRNKHFSLAMPLAGRIPTCYYDYGLETQVACYIYNKQLICVDDDGKCDY